MKIEVETKYEIGQKVYIVDRGLAFEYFVREVQIEAIHTSHEYKNGILKEYVIYAFHPQWLLGKRQEIEYKVYASEAEAQADADRFNELLREGEDK